MKAAKRRGLGESYAAEIFEEEKPAAKAAGPKAAQAKAPPVAKIRATFHLPTALFEECRNAVVHLSGPPLRLTLAAFAENAIRAELERLRKEHTKGKPFPHRSGELRGGRPIKA